MYVAANRTSASELMALNSRGGKEKNGASGPPPPGESSTPPAGRQEPPEAWGNYPETLGGDGARRKRGVEGKKARAGGGRGEQKKSKIHEDGEKSDGGNGICAI